MSFVNVQGVRLYYEVYGPVRSHHPPLLLIAGLGFATWSWFKQIPVLASHCQIIVFDNRGSGNSESLPQPYTVATLADDAAGLLDAFGVERAHVLGTSLGGFVAQELTLRYPERVAKLILCCTSFGGANSIPMDWSSLNATMGWGTLSKTQAIRRGLEVATSADYRSAYPEEFAQLVNWRSGPQSQVDYIRQVAAGARFDAAQRVQTIAAPTLIIHGMNDRVVPVKNAELLAQAIPGATLQLVDSAGHLVFIEQADEVNRAIMDFLPVARQRPIPSILHEGKTVLAKPARPLGQVKKWLGQRLHLFRTDEDGNACRGS